MNKKRVFTTAGKLIAVIAILYLIDSSNSFRTCIAEKQKQQTEQQTKENSTVVTSSIIWHGQCFGGFLYDYREGITAIATVFIALFTLTLWIVTGEIRKGGELWGNGFRFDWALHIRGNCADEECAAED